PAGLYWSYRLPPRVVVQRIGPDQSGYLDGSYCEASFFEASFFEVSWASAGAPTMNSAASAMAPIVLRSGMTVLLVFVAQSGKALRRAWQGVQPPTSNAAWMCRGIRPGATSMA